MSARPPAGPRNDELAFTGAVVASLSHQLANVMSIVGELAGLASDMAGGGRGSQVSPEKLAGLAGRIQDNVARGSEVVRLLSRFAHAADRSVEDVDLGEHVRLVVAIAQRFAALRQVRLEAAVADSPVRWHGNSFGLLHALFTCVQWALSVTGVRIVRVTLGGAAERALVRVAGDAAYPVEAREAGGRPAELEALCLPLGAAGRLVREESAFAFELEIGHRTPGGGDGEST